MHAIHVRTVLPPPLARRLAHTLVALAERQGVARITRQEAMAEAVALWLDRHEADLAPTASGPPSPASPSTGEGTTP